jgi:hypothetical protein
VPLALSLTGCAEFVDVDQGRAELGTEVVLEAGCPVGQTFVAHHAGLDGVEIWLEPSRDGKGEIRLSLRADPQAEEELATAVLPVARAATPRFHRFSFSPLHDSHSRYYYAVLELAGDGVVQVGAGPGDAYLNGALYRDHQPLDAQAAFRLVYDPGWVLVDLGWTAVKGLGLLVLAGLLYVVPGWALLAWLWPGFTGSSEDGAEEKQLPWGSKLGLAAGLSLALYPILFLWTDLVGLHLGPLYAWLPVVGGSVALVWRYRDWRPRRGWKAVWQWGRSEVLWPDVAFLIVMGLVFGVRLLVVRALDAPMWGDSYQHTMIAQLLVDNGGLFDSWEPYTPYRSLTVHFGFPAAVAVFSWITRVGSTQATLLVGQLINALAILTLYPLAVSLARGNRWAGVGAVLTAGLLTTVPACYVNWGRYAQLAGQVVLPTALCLLWGTARKGRFSWRMMLLAGLALSGMTLSYYRMPFYYATFVLAWLVGWGLSNWEGDVKRWLRGLVRLMLIGGVALLVFLPWGLHVSGGKLASAVEAGVAARPALGAVLASYGGWRGATLYVSLPLLVAALGALIYSLMKRCWIVASVVLWVLVLASLVAGQVIGLPGANMMQHFAVMIALYIPVGLLVGWLIGQGVALAERRAGAVGRLAASVVIFAVAVWAAGVQMKIVQPSYVMVTRPDMHAMAWIQENTPPNARFLVEGFRIYGGTSAVGADAGWWIPLLAGRENTMPPQYALFNEVPADEGYTRRVVDLVAQLEAISPASPRGVQLLCDWSITHVYVGQGQGEVGSGAVQLFSPEALGTSHLFYEVYRQDRVHVFSLDSRACGTDEE